MDTNREWTSITGEHTMNYDPRYHSIAIHVLDELNRYTGFNYTINFTTSIDVDHMAFAIQRAVEHMEAGGVCQHEETCKPALPYTHPFIHEPIP